MASGSFHSNTGVNLNLYCEWSSTTNVAGNYSIVTMNTYLEHYSLYVGARSDSYVKCNDKNYTYNAPAISYGTDVLKNTTLLSSKSFTVYHNSDGKKSITLEAGWRYSGTYNGISIDWITCYDTINLDNIPRASEPSLRNIENTQTITTAYVGVKIRINTNTASSTFKHKAFYSIGNGVWSQITDESYPYSQIVTNYYEWTIPKNLMNSIPNNTSGIVSVKVVTYSDSSLTAKIGEKVVKLTIYASSDIIPSIDSVAAEIVNSNPIIEGWGIAVAGYTKVEVTAFARGSYGSTISSFTITGGYSTTQAGSSLDYEGGVISSSGSVSFSVTAKDSRGRVSSASSSSVTFYEYTKPQVTSFVAQRGSTSTSMDIKANWSFSSIGGHNSATAKLYYKKSTSSSWTQYGTISKNTLVSITGFDEANSYNFKVTVTDSLSSSASEETFVSTIGVLLDFRAGGRGLGVGKIAESNAMEVALDSVFIGNVYIKVGVSNISLKNYIKGVMDGTY